MSGQGASLGTSDHEPEAVGYAILGGGPAGLTGRTRSACAATAPSSSRPTSRSAGSRRRSSSTGTASTSAATASSRSSARRAPVGGHDGRRVPDPPAPVAHLLRRQVLLLPADVEGRRGAARPVGVGSLRALVPLGAAPPAADGGDVRGVGHRALRPPALRRLLPLVHGEGLGDPGLGDPLALGRPADQGLLALEGRPDDRRAPPRSTSRP